MIDANRNTSVEVLDQLKAASYERFRIELFGAVEKLLEDFKMTWDDLAEKLDWGVKGETLKNIVGDAGTIPLKELNEIAHTFSTEPYIIFRPRHPWTQT